MNYIRYMLIVVFFCRQTALDYVLNCGNTKITLKRTLLAVIGLLLMKETTDINTILAQRGFGFSGGFIFNQVRRFHLIEVVELLWVFGAKFNVLKRRCIFHDREPVETREEIDKLMDCLQQDKSKMDQTLFKWSKLLMVNITIYF